MGWVLNASETDRKIRFLVSSTEGAQGTVYARAGVDCPWVFPSNFFRDAGDATWCGVCGMVNTVSAIPRVSNFLLGSRTCLISCRFCWSLIPFASRIPSLRAGTRCLWSRTYGDSFSRAVSTPAETSIPPSSPRKERMLNSIAGSWR